MLKEKLNNIVIICFISLFLLIASSPILSLLWLVLPTGYFLYSRNYKNILKIWGFTICIWYFIFTTSLSGITILIGFENTKVIINYLLDNTFMFETLCFQTVYILDFLSAKLGFPLYIPSIINIFSVFLNLFKNDKPKCSGKDKSNASSPWWGKSSKKSEGEKSLEKCKILEKELRKSESIIPSFHKSKSTIDGKTTTTYSETWIPFIGNIINCHSRNATELEKKVYKANEKNKIE
jgi:hypothetical protein